MAKPQSGVSPPKKNIGGGSTGAVIAIVVVAILGITVVCGGILAALLLPAVQAAREAARRTSCQNNLKQIGLALHNYHDVYNTFPPAYIPDEDGEPMRSWRASVLPFIEQAPLYDRYDFHKRWDDPENQFATTVSIPAYRCPSDPGQTPFDTSYVLITGTGTIFEAGNPAGISSILDGTANTVMAVEIASSGIAWPKPEDLDIEAFVAMFGGSGAGRTRSPHPGGVNALFADGSVRFLSFDIPQNEARALATRAGMERVQTPY